MLDLKKILAVKHNRDREDFKIIVNNSPALDNDTMKKLKIKKGNTVLVEVKPIGMLGNMFDEEDATQ